MDDRRDDIVDKVADEVMLPGFRFHPTDEELVGFYLKRKIQQKTLSIELIRQLDIYKYDPWDLPKLATTGEKEWYFYCPRDRKYRNSARPNRVTGAGFWKATGTDRPIYSSEGTNKCIGLKKSLVFYKGRAAKGVKTDWMMHEFRLPSLADPSMFKKPNLDKSFPANDCWAICRIFKKTNSVMHRTLAQSWVSPLHEFNETDLFSVSQTTTTTENTQLTNSDHHNLVSCTTEAASTMQFNCNNSSQLLHLQQQVNNSIDHLSSYKPINNTSCHKQPSIFPSSNAQISNTNFMFTPIDIQMPSMLLNMPSTLMTGDFPKVSASLDFSQLQHQTNGFPSLENATGPLVMPTKNIKDHVSRANNSQLRVAGKTSIIPFNLPPNFSDEWKANFPWDSLPYSSEMTSFSTNI